MARSFRFGVMTTAMLALSASAAFADYQLNILHINDFHSRIEAINKNDATCSPDEQNKKECFGGAARLKTLVDERRKALAGQNILTLNAGDNYQGSLFYTTYKGAAEAEFMSLMGFDAMTVGNHEFDDGEDGLLVFLDKVKFPVLGANVLAGDSSKIKGKVVPSTVVEVGGQKIGIVGAVTRDTEELASPGPNIMIADDVDTLTKAVQDLKAQGVNKIIALTHVGYMRDQQAIAKIPDVDVVVGGHSHTLLSNTDKTAEGPYPTWVDNPGGYRVPIVTARSYGKYLGDLVVTFDDAGVVKDAKGDPILIDSTIAPDAVVEARVKELGGPIEELKKKVVGKTDAVIDGGREVCRIRECSMGNLVADAMLDRVKDQGIQIAFANGGGLRASIDAGDVSMGSVLTVLPFQNTLATFQLKGVDVIAALENGASQIEQGAGRFSQVSGLKYSFDKSKPPGSRISNVMVKEGDGFVALDPNKTYGVVANDYTRRGGDGYKVFAEKAANAYDFGPSLETVVADFLAKNNPYKPYTDGRIVEVAGSSSANPPPTASSAAPQSPAPPAAEAPAAPAPSAPPAVSSAPATQTSPAPGTDTQVAPAKPPAPEPAKPEAASSEPSKPEPALAPSAPTTHVVAAGDTLWDLAVKFYGDGAFWTKISAANGKPTPRRLVVGKELEIPAK